VRGQAFRIGQIVRDSRSGWVGRISGRTPAGYRVEWAERRGRNLPAMPGEIVDGKHLESVR